MTRATKRLPERPAEEPDSRDRILGIVQMGTGFLQAMLVYFATIHIVDPGQSGFAVELKRLVAAFALAFANMATMRVCLTKGARLAAQGSEIAKAAIIVSVAVLVPLNAAIGYLGLAATEVPKLVSLETCAEIRLQAAGFDQAAVAQGQLIRTIDTQRTQITVRKKQERAGTRGTGKKSEEKRPEPVAQLWAEAERVAGEVSDQFAKGAVDRTAKMRDLRDIADLCEKTIREPKRWSKGGAAAVVGLHDRATGVTRELASISPVSSAQGLAESYRGIGKDANADNTAVADFRRTLGTFATLLEKEIAALPRAPDPMAALPATSLISAAFEGERLKSLWPLALMSLTIELGGPLAILLAYTLHRRRFEDRDRGDDNDTTGGNP